MGDGLAFARDSSSRRSGIQNDNRGSRFGKSPPLRRRGSLIEKGEDKLKEIRAGSIYFLQKELGLELNRKNDTMVKSSQGLKFLGMKIYPLYRKLSDRNIARIRRRLRTTNLSSYYGLAKNNQSTLLKEINWRILEYID